MIRRCPFRPAVEALESRLVPAAPKFVAPLYGTPPVTPNKMHGYDINNYVDQDPTSGIKDYKGGDYTYDGHTGLDIDIGSWLDQDRGVPVYAAASGKVIDAHDGEFDHNTSTGNRPANFVAIDHGDGYVTYYYHLRKNSVLVHVGEQVSAGQPLGLAGSSGSSTAPHLHFEVQHNGQVIETYKNPTTYWYHPWPYAGDTPGIRSFGIINRAVSNAEIQDGVADIDVIKQTSTGGSVYLWFTPHGIKVSDKLQIRWYEPDGTLYTTQTVSHGELRDAFYYWGTGLPNSPALGTWTAVLYNNGNELCRDHFTVTTSSAVLAGKLNLSAAQYWITENSGVAKITVNRSGTLGAATVRYATSAGTATAGLDYLNTSGTLSFKAGETRKSFYVTIKNEAVRYDEPTETFTVRLSSATGASLGSQTSATVNILDDDPPPSVNVGDKQVTEGNTGTIDMNFTVSLTARSGWTVTVAYKTVAGTATSSDFTATSGTVTFKPGETTKQVTVKVKGDRLHEPTEVFYLVLSKPSHVLLGDAVGKGFIKDND